MSAVEATKSLRDKKKPLSHRVELARDILNGSNGTNVAIIPRKEIVILDWAFDMLATDGDALVSLGLWQLLLWLWPQTPLEGRNRTFKNHKFFYNVTEALQKPKIGDDFVSVLVDFTKLVSKSINGPIFQFNNDQQATQLLMAYCSCPAAVSNEDMSEIVFDSLKVRTHIFIKMKNSKDVLNAILNERNETRRLIYLRDFLSIREHSVVPSVNVENIDQILIAACDVHKNNNVISTKDAGNSGNVKLDETTSIDVENEKEATRVPQSLLQHRIIELASSYPHFLPQIIEVVHNRQPSVLSAEMFLIFFKMALDSSPDWKAVNICLRLNPSSLLEESGVLIDRLLSPSVDLPSNILATFIMKMSDLRRIPDFFSKWKPKSPVLDTVIKDALLRSFEKLSPPQITKILDGQMPNTDRNNLTILKIILRSLNYRIAAMPLVADKLAEIFDNSNTPDELKADILNIQPSISITKPSRKDNTFVLLRYIELGLSDDPVSLSSSAAKRFDTDSETNTAILMRYFPVLETYLDEHRLKKIIKRTSHSVRLVMVRNHDLLECAKITNVIIDTSISQMELDVLNEIPKQVFSWSQRHAAVENALSKEGYSFEQVAQLIDKVIDAQNPPKTTHFVNGLLKIALPHHAKLLMSIILSLKTGYLKELLECKGLPEWQVCCIQSAIAKKHSENNANTDYSRHVTKWIEKNYMNFDYSSVVLEMLSLFPSLSKAEELTRKISLEFTTRFTGSDFPRELFQILCSQNYPCDIITAFYVLSECRFEDDYIEYLRLQRPEKITQLLYKATNEKAYNLLKALISSKVVPDTSSIRNVITIGVLTASDLVNDTIYWEFCDCVLREQSNLITQFTLESILELISTSTENCNQSENDMVWVHKALVLSRIFLLKRGCLKRRLHLAINAMTSLLLAVRNQNQAMLFYRLVDNLCNPPQLNTKSRIELNSQVAKERRHVSKHVGVLLQNIILTIISNTNQSNTWTESNAYLRSASLHIIDLIYGDGLKAVSAGMDNASRAYLRSLFDYYKVHGRWTSDD